MSLVYQLHRNDSPLLISMPHSGLQVPPAIAARFTAVAKTLPDTDWHIPQLYDFIHELGATVLTANYSRYVVDLNRPPDNQNLYPGQIATGLCPVKTFAGEPVYLAGENPDDAEIAQRMHDYWQPYHRALTEETERIKSRHGYCLLYDAHSIRSCLPRLFDGKLPVVNLGTVHGESCAPALRTALLQVIEKNKEFDWVADGRFIGGYIARCYGKPEQGVHAVQMELVQKAYMSENADYTYLPAIARPLQKLLHALLETMLGWNPGQDRVTAE